MSAPFNARDPLAGPPVTPGRSGHRFRIRRAGWVLLALLAPAVFAQETPAAPPAGEKSMEEPVVETVIPYEDDQIVIRSREQTSEKGILRVSGDVVIRYRDIEIRADSLEYDTNIRRISGQGHIQFHRGVQEISCDSFEFDMETKTGRFIKAKGVADDNVHFKAAEGEKTGVDVYIFRDGEVTTCQYEHPHWLFQSGYTRVVKDKTATLHGSVFKMFGVPVFYLPWVKMPILRRERKSGLLIPSIGVSNDKGWRFTQGVYLTLGRSADMTVTGDYYSKRGYGVGVAFRSRFSEVSYLNVSTYSVDDSQDEGGTALTIDSFFRFGNGYRGSIAANYISNIVFRQVYEGDFAGAIRPDEAITGFLTKAWDECAANIQVDRRTYYFDNSQVTSRDLPGGSFRVIGWKVPSVPAYFFLDSSAAAVSKDASWQETDPDTGITQEYSFITPRTMARLDVYPRLVVPLKLGDVARISLTPSVRATYYTHSQSEEPANDPQERAVAESVSRLIAGMEARLDTPRIYKVYDVFGQPVKHVMEAGATWRWISDVDDFRRIILIDATDAIVGTNEVEYWLVNRFIGRRAGMPWEWVAVELRQKYFLDPDFGGDFRLGEPNQLEPYYTFSPYIAAYEPQRFTPLQARVRVYPGPELSGDVRLEYDTEAGYLRDWSVAATWHRDWLFTSVAYLRLNSIENRSQDNDFLQTSVGVGRPMQGWSVDFNVSYNFATTNLDNFYIRVNYYTDCLGLSTEYSNFNIYTRRSEHEIRFSLYLRGLGEFGQLRKLGRRYF
jgi:LPS-assembly protein